MLKKSPKEKMKKIANWKRSSDDWWETVPKTRVSQKFVLEEKRKQNRNIEELSRDLWS